MAENLFHTEVLNKINDVMQDLEKKQTNLFPLLSAVSELIDASVHRNFEEGGRWDGDAGNITLFSGGSRRWQDLAPSTQKAYEGTYPIPKATLHRTGFLESSFLVQAVGSQIVISVNAKYAAAHQFGSEDGNTPARPYVVLQQDDLTEIYEMTKDYLLVM